MEKKPAQSEFMYHYFSELEKKLHLEMDIANAARANGEDPHPYVEIPLAKDLADRVENLIGVKGVAQRLREIEADGKNREESALQIGKEIAERQRRKFQNQRSGG
jgi:DNA polymerase II large subunit DP2.